MPCLKWSLRCIANKYPGDVDAAGPEATFGVAMTASKMLACRPYCL